MDETQQAAPPPAPAPQPVKTSVERVSFLVVVGLLAAALLWLFPAYKETISERDDYKAKYEAVSSKTNQVTIAKTYFQNGNLKSETDTRLNVSTNETDSSTDQSHSFNKTVEKRNVVSVGLLWGTSVIPSAADADTNLIGPLGAQAFFQWDPHIQALAGVKLGL